MGNVSACKYRQCCAIRKIPTILLFLFFRPNILDIFGEMFEIKWVPLSPETLYYCHNQFVLKKRKVKSYFVYTVWEHNIMVFITYNEYQFLQIARKILNNLRINWGGNDL